MGDNSSYFVSESLTVELLVCELQSFVKNDRGSIVWCELNG